MYRTLAVCALLLLLAAPSQTFALRSSAFHVPSTGAAEESVGVAGGAAARILAETSSLQVQPAVAAATEKAAAGPAKPAEAAKPADAAAAASKQPAAPAEKQQQQQTQPAPAQPKEQLNAKPAASAPELLSSTVQAASVPSATNGAEGDAPMEETVFILQDAGEEYYPAEDGPAGTYSTGKPEKKYAAAQAKLAEAEDRLRLQKYYDTELQALPADDGESGDDSVSTYARPTRASSKAAKYASSALKKAQPYAAAAEAPKGLGGIAAGLFGGNRNKADALSTPKLDQQEGYVVDASQLEADVLSAVQGGLNSASNRGAQLLAQGQARPRAGQAKLQQTTGGTHTKPLSGITMSASTLASLPPGSIAFNAKYPNGVVNAQSDLGVQLMQDPNSNVVQYTPHMKVARRLATFRTLNTVESNFGQTGFLTGTPPAPVFSGPANVFVRSSITCGVTTNTVSVGTCTGTGMGTIPTNATGFGSGTILMTFYCNLNPENAVICGTKWVPGMLLTALGPVNVEIANNNVVGINKDDTTTSLPIIGVNVPGKRTTLLADVANILSGVKGGTLSVSYKIEGNGDKINSGGLTFYYDR